MWWGLAWRMMVSRKPRTLPGDSYATSPLTAICRRTGRPLVRHFGHRAGPRLSVPAHQAPRGLPGRWADRHHHAGAGRQRLQGAGPAGDCRKQARRRWHAAGAAAANLGGRRLHAGADSAGRVPPALHHQDQLGPGQGHCLCAQCHGLCLWPGGAGRLTAQELDAFCRLGQGQPRQADLRLDRHADQPAFDHGADRAKAGPAAPAHSLQGQRRPDAGDSGRPHHGGGRFHRFCAAGRGRQAARAQHLGRAALGDVSRCAHAQGTGPGPGA